MNMSDLVLSENENFKFVTIVFAPYTGNKAYHYKTLDSSIQVDDFVVVNVNGEFKVVKVLEVNDPLEVDMQEGIKYKWVVQRVDTTEHEKCVELDNALQEKLNKAARRKRQQELREDSLKFLSDEERSEAIKLVRL